MGALAVMVLAFAGYIVMYKLYGRFIGLPIFQLFRKLPGTGL